MPVGLFEVFQRIVQYIRMLWMEVDLLVVIQQVILTSYLGLVKFLRLSVDISVAFDWPRGLIWSMNPSLFSFIVICLRSLVNLWPINLCSI